MWFCLSSYAAIRRSHWRKQARRSRADPIIDFKAVWLLGFPRSHPLLEPVCRDQAPAEFQCIAERRLRGRGLSPSIDHPSSSRRVLRPAWNEPPSHQRHFPDGLLGILADDRDGLGRSDVIAWTPVVLARGGVEELLNKLLPPRKFVAPTHEEIMADRASVQHSQGWE
jgi:hypothetical protein